MTVSVVVVSYHTGPILLRCLESALKQEGLAEVILVDNGNPPEVEARLDAFAAKHPKLLLLRGHGNVGFAKGCNLGAAKATGAHIALLNPDCLLPEAVTLQQAIAAMAANPDAWLAGAQMVDADGNAQGGSKRRLIDPWVALSQVLHLYRLGEKFPSVNLPESPEEAEPLYVPAVSGAFMLLPATRYRELGGLDEHYFFHVEDLDLCHTIASRGGKVLYVPAVKIVHYRSSSRVSSLFVERHKTAGFIRYFRKHKQIHPLPVFWLVAAGIYGRLYLRSIKSALYGIIERRKANAEALRLTRQRSLLDSPVESPQGDYSGLSPAVVAGATGQVGLNVLHHLLASGIETFGLYHRQVLDYEHPKLHWLQGTLALADADLRAAQPRTLIHTPALWLLPSQLDAFAAMGVKRVIAFSTTSIMGKASSKNPYEQHAIRSLVLAEKELGTACARLGIALTILRPTMIYGCGLDRNVSSIVRFIRAFGFFPVAYPGGGLREPVHADDLARAVMACLINPATHGKVYNLGGGERLSYRTMVERIFTTLGKSNRTLNLPGLPVMLDLFSFLTGRKDTSGEIARRMNSDLVFDSSPATQDFNYTPRGFLSAGKNDFGAQA